ncbi:MAG: SGNH/GDSL hydrolase family protein [Thermodesulfobacteriota bacterium]
MPGQRHAAPESWFHRNPKKTLVFFILFLVLLLAFAAEKYLEFSNHRKGIILSLEGERRYIKLREYRPGTSLLLTLPRNHLPYTDNVFSKEYRFKIDSNGFIAPSKKYDHPDKVIVFLGGSTTECMFVDEDQRFPYLVGKMLEEETGKKINSYNGGMSGNNTLHAIDILVNKVIPLNPQVVVFMENINDLSTLLYEGTYWNERSVRAPLETLEKTKLVGKLLKEILFPQLNQAYRNLKEILAQEPWDEFAQARGKKLTIDKARFVQEFSMNLQSLVCICQAHGITPVLMTQANRITDRPDPVVAAYIGRYGADTGIGYTQLKELFDAFNGTIREVGQKNQVMVIDLAQEIPPDKKFIYDIVHLNDAGCQLAARIIAARLKGLIAPR